MASNIRDGFVTAYYANPKTNKIEIHHMSSISFHEATHPVEVNDGSGRITKRLSGEEHLWSLDPPVGFNAADADDFTPAQFIPPAGSSPPPAVATQSPNPLRRSPERPRRAA